MALRALVRPTSPVERALCAIPDHEPPFRNVEAVADFALRERDTLELHWRRLLSDAPANARFFPSVSLRTFVADRLFLAALARKRRYRTWRDVARELGTTYATLWRRSGQRFGKSLDELTDVHPLLAVGVYEQELGRLGVRVE
ncbi:MAG TPA: hypothetical protein VJR92_15895 [Gemmatimonadaceae bacterium]|nr:hypothetical protein [Gemmatimonadaceae bacterium]